MPFFVDVNPFCWIHLRYFCLLENLAGVEDGVRRWSCSRTSGDAAALDIDLEHFWLTDGVYDVVPYTSNVQFGRPSKVPTIKMQAKSDTDGRSMPHE